MIYIGDIYQANPAALHLQSARSLEKCCELH